MGITPLLIFLVANQRGNQAAAKYSVNRTPQHKLQHWIVAVAPHNCQVAIVLLGRVNDSFGH